MSSRHPYQIGASLYSLSDDFDLYAPARREVGRHDHGRRHRAPHSPIGRPSRPRRRDPAASYHDHHHRRTPSEHYQQSTRSIPRVPSFGQRLKNSASHVLGAPSPRFASGTGALSPKPVHQAHHSAHNEKHALPPYESPYDHLVEDDVDDELEEMMRGRRLRRTLKYSAYALLAFLVILGCALTGYFVSPRSPVIALHSVNSLERPDRVFKLQGTKMQFHIILTYRVQNDNFFDLVVDDISTAVFWPETKFALGGGRLSSIKVPPRRTVEIAMPLTIRYDVKRGPPPILLGMVESCGLHDAGLGEMNLEAEVQADFHTKMKQSSVQSGRQSISIKCPVRRMAMLQVDDGTSGNLGDIVRTLNV
ncbi:hypothetical protein GGH94_000807 [Coemansia aciculifera]|uniref:Late embryogenesis abundant protein LEA-2 subgroup domain-containing protein n=1 Tax=Coemansia aciculifera TaxID=417176 RepID=A0A9W8IP08_9FUNG|nr:hypothetical protein GGH94_000807 [Coemansia aciculifera]KAJ2873318.1 hypothetical protein GGH93_003302 [Coemansia aciculifera]